MENHERASSRKPVADPLPEKSSEGGGSEIPTSADTEGQLATKYRVFVLGSLNSKSTHGQRDQFEACCERLGQELAKHKFLIGVASAADFTVDLHILAGANQYCQDRPSLPVEFVGPSKLPADEPPLETNPGNFPNLSCKVRIARGDWESAHGVQLKEADGVILIGGNSKGVSIHLGRKIAKSDQPFIPVPIFEGAGAVLWDDDRKTKLKAAGIALSDIDKMDTEFDSETIVRVMLKLIANVKASATPKNNPQQTLIKPPTTSKTVTEPKDVPDAKRPMAAANKRNRDLVLKWLGPSVGMILLVTGILSHPDKDCPSGKMSEIDFDRLAKHYYVEQRWEDFDTRFANPTTAKDSTHYVWRAAVDASTDEEYTTVHQLYVHVLTECSEYLDRVIFGTDTLLPQLKDGDDNQYASDRRWLGTLEERSFQSERFPDIGSKSYFWWYLFLTLHDETIERILESNKAYRVGQKTLSSKQAKSILRGTGRGVIYVVGQKALVVFREAVSGFHENVKTPEKHKAWYGANRTELKKRHMGLAAEFANCAKKEYQKCVVPGNAEEKNMSKNAFEVFLEAEITSRFPFPESR